MACSFAEDPARSFREARILWSAISDPSVISVHAEPMAAGDKDGFDLRTSGRPVTIALGERIEHIAIDSPIGQLRIDVMQGSLLHGPARIAVQLPCDEYLTYSLNAVSKLMRVFGITGGARWRMPADSRLPRLVEALRIGDAVCEGVSLRDIAAGMLGKDRIDREWPGEGESLKSWVRRRVALARRLREAGPQSVLQFSI